MFKKIKAFLLVWTHGTKILRLLKRLENTLEEDSISRERKDWYIREIKELI